MVPAYYLAYAYLYGGYSDPESGHQYPAFKYSYYTVYYAMAGSEYAIYSGTYYLMGVAGSVWILFLLRAVLYELCRTL